RRRPLDPHGRRVGIGACELVPEIDQHALRPYPELLRKLAVYRPSGKTAAAPCRKGGFPYDAPQNRPLKV
ncbi:hypothetical protein, partial [Parvibaculum sp.]|uniref:hypothetical protein n=1 Tax=Parvibaculum sp. TaxID=2024848 RepID=UPI002BFF2BCA